jgi:glycosyltransferase involved in cell wall biosynthesis
MTGVSVADVGQPEKSAGSPAQVRPRRKVFHLVDSLEVGGTETQAVELALRMSSAESDITLGCLRARGPLLDRLRGSSVAVEEFYPKGGIDSPGGIYQLLRLAAFLRRGKFEVVHTHDLWSNLMGVPAARLAGVPAIISSQRDLSHFAWYQGVRRRLLRQIQRLSHVVLANATPIRDALIAEDGFSPESLRVIHNGVDTAKFQNGKRDRARLFPAAGEGALIVLVGNMHTDVKGHPWLIAASPAVVREFPETRFVFAGDGESRPVFERQVQKLGLERSFMFLGRRADIPDLLASCDLAVLPSKAEGLPNAMLEYMAAGLPVVASRVGGNAELVEEGVTGLLVPAQDSEALSVALLRLLRDPELARRLAAAGQQRATHDFSFERLIREMGELYTELLGRREIRR